MIALDEYWSRTSFIAVQGSSGDPGDLLPIDDELAVENHRDCPSDQSHVITLPLARRLTRVDPGPEKTVYASDPVTFWGLSKIVLDLSFVSATKVNTAVAPFGISKLRVYLEVRKLSIRDKVLAGLLVNHCAFLYHPTVR